MRIGKIELTQEKVIITASAITLVIMLVIYLAIYLPLIKEVKAEYSECKTIENEVLNCYSIIESAEKAYGERVLITEKDISPAIDELTKHGKLQGINFVSIRPKKISKEKDSQYKILPLEIKIESTYEQLGMFLGELDNMEKSLLKVKSFDISPDKKSPSILIADLVVDIYLSEK